jgi:pimeloyl-ACP methyl ester carboxylesterase
MRRLILVLMAMLSSLNANAEFSNEFIRQHPLETVLANDIEIAYREIGQEGNPKVLLIMGLGASNLVHGDNMVRGLQDLGYQVLIFDNRDTGGSTRFDDWGQPTIWWQLLKNSLRLPVNAPYNLDDMAKDTVALMEALDYEDAHLVGLSMGGMIAQKVAANYPQRVRSLTSVMSTTFARHLPPPTKEARKALTNFSSGKSAPDTTELMLERGFFPNSMPRQMMAIFSSGDRSNEVKRITADTLIIHGEDDGLVPPSHGEHTASLIKNSKIVIFKDMGHNIPPPVLPKMLSAMTKHMQSADLSRIRLH